MNKIEIASGDRKRKSVRTLGLVLLVAAPCVHATPVVVTGGFTSFDGFVGGDDNGITQTLNGTTLCATAGCATSGNAHVTYATPQSALNFINVAGVNNRVAFTPANSQEVNGIGPANPFFLGRLTFENGIWTGDASFGFTLTTHSSDPTLDGHTFSDTIVMNLTPNDFAFATPDQNADFIHFAANPQIGSLRAYELQDSPNGSNIVTAALFGYIGSLHLASLGDVLGGGFINSSVDLAPAPTTVPEPSMLALMALGAVALLRRRRSPSQTAGEDHA